MSQNAGDADIKGAELELEAIIGGGLSLNLAYGYLDATYTRIAPNATEVTIHSSLPKTPKTKLTVSPTWDVKLSDSGTLRFAADYTRTAEMANDAPNTPLLRRPASDNLSASIHYLSPENKYEVTLGGTNLTDDRYLTVGSVNGAEGETVGTYNPPSQWYLSLRMTFE